jgi:Fe-S cluster biogenesis protein NfuA
MVKEKISAVLVEVEPLLRIEHCRIRLVDFSVESGVLTLSIDAACPDCDISAATFSTAIESRVKMSVPEVKEVRVA